ncbi:MAG: hypothetical protein ACOCV2_06285, partial [Persicimonas sp.]
VEIATDELILGSIHGSWQRYGEHSDNPEDFDNALTADECPDLQDEPSDNVLEKKTCANDVFGSADSGDRYERFLLEFDEEQIFPKREDDEEHLPGLICKANEIPSTLESLGGAIAEGTESCIEDPPYACEEADDCPAFAHEAEDDGGGPSCEEFGESGDRYCTSAVQVRMYPRDGADTSVEDLEDHDYCLSDTIDSDMTPGGCIVARDKYSLTTCGSRDDAATLQWEESGAKNALEGYQVDLVYSTSTDE